MNFFEVEYARVSRHPTRLEMCWGNNFDSMAGDLAAPEFSFYGPAYITDSPFSGCNSAIHFFIGTDEAREAKTLSDAHIGWGSIPTSDSSYLIMNVLYQKSQLPHLF